MHVHTKLSVKVLYKMFELWCRDTHVWIVCMCAYALQEDRSQDIPLTLSPLEDEICNRRCSSPLKLLFFTYQLSNFLLQILSVLQWNQANKDLGSYNLPLWLFHGKTSSSPYNFHSNKLKLIAYSHPHITKRSLD